MKQFPFEKLRVWQVAKENYLRIRDITSTFPQDERYELVSQMNRAAHGVVSNIAEGSCRTLNKEKARFYNMVYASLMEVSSDVIIASELSYISKDQLKYLRSSIYGLTMMISALRNYTLK